MPKIVWRHINTQCDMISKCDWHVMKEQNDISMRKCNFKAQWHNVLFCVLWQGFDYFTVMSNLILQMIYEKRTIKLLEKSSKIQVYI